MNIDNVYTLSVIAYSERIWHGLYHVVKRQCVSFLYALLLLMLVVAAVCYLVGWETVLPLGVLLLTVVALIGFNVFFPDTDVDTHYKTYQQHARDYNLSSIVDGTRTFAESYCPSSMVVMCVQVCVEELAKNIREHASYHFLNVNASSDKDCIRISMIDDGQPFNPKEAKDKGVGLTLVHSLCPDMEYNRLLGRNIIHMKWYKDDARNHYQPSSSISEDELAKILDAPQTNSRPLLELSGVSKTYGGEVPVHVLKGIDLVINEGDLVSITGESGSGKTTLLNIIGLLDTYDDGELYIGGNLIKGLSREQVSIIRNEMMGFIFQTFNLIDYKNALENVAMPLYYRGIDSRTRATLAMEYLEKVGLKDYWHHLPSQLSGGQRQRVAIARALITHPKILLADEPTGALDRKRTIEIMELIKELNNEGQTVIIVTHEQDIADQTKRKLVVNDGLIFENERTA